ncbi:MAG: hypothetical protein KKE86_12240 [Planctomycetes bacterium]|nr:hypothetical protein [Planctomycetota bacterium]MBU4400091.1 hypothetical protein [Planctomycetota bacterium]MCG2683561.1 hypothetical protein [Planctomycetales bacterium]
MYVDELIRDGVCEDLEEALFMFPIETIDDFGPARRTGCPSEPTLGNGLGRYPRQKLASAEKARFFQQPLDAGAMDRRDARPKREQGPR